MQTCVQIWNDENVLDDETNDPHADPHPQVSTTAIQCFLNHLLPALNDPFLFKHKEKYKVEATTRAFWTSLLSVGTTCYIMTTIAYSFLSIYLSIDILICHSVRVRVQVVCSSIIASFSCVDNLPSYQEEDSVLYDHILRDGSEISLE